MRNLDEKVKIEVSKDNMIATVEFEHPQGEGILLTKQQVYEYIKSSDIKYGLDEKLINLISEKRSYNKKYIIATGLEATTGKNGSINILFDTSAESLKPKILADGSVDYRNLDNIKMTEKGEVLAKVLPPTIGDVGYDVYGNTIPGKEGKPCPKLPKGKGTIVSEDGTEIISDVTGKIIYVDNKISVTEVYEIKGDVGVGTGNILFNGSVIVKGNVMTDFSIKAAGNIEVFGVVEGAEIYSGGNIFISKGITGMHKAFIQAQGNITSKLVKDARLVAGKDIFAEAIMHSKLKVQGKIELKGKKGLLVGGKASAALGIRAKTIGSPMGTITEIYIGVDRNLLEEHNKLTLELGKLKQNYNENAQYLNSMVKKKDTIAGKRDFKTSFLNTVNRVKSLKAKMEEIEEKLNTLSPLIESCDSTSILDVEKIVYPGTNVQIGNAFINIGDEIYKSKFRNYQGEIKVINI